MKFDYLKLANIIKTRRNEKGISTRKLAEKHKPIGLEENRIIAKEGGTIANNTRKDIESRLGENIVNKNNSLKYEYIDNNKIE